MNRWITLYEPKFMFSENNVQEHVICFIIIYDYMFYHDLWLYVLSWFMLNMLCALHVLVNCTFVLTGLLAHYLRSCCRYKIWLASWLAGSYVGGWVWSRTTTCYVNSAASFHKCICICIIKVCNNVYLALPVFKFTNLVNDLWEQRSRF